MARTVVILISKWSRTGGIRALVELANGLCVDGYPVSFLVMDPINRFPFAVCDGVGTRSIAIDRLSGAPGKLVTRLLAVFRIPRCDTLVFSDYPSAFIARAAQRLGRVRQPIFFVQSYDPLFFGEKHLKTGRSLRRAVAAASYDLRLSYVGSSTFMRDLLQSGHAQSAVVANPGVDTSVFRPYLERPAGESLVIGTVGRSLSAKGLDRFVQAVEIVRQCKPDCRIRLITGDSINGLGVSQLEVISPKDDYALTRAYADLDVFVATSLFESYALTLLEAMACGVPVVTTDNRGLHDYAVHGQNCLIVPRASPDLLATNILNIIDDLDLRQRLVIGGLNTARQFPWCNMVDTFEKVILAG